MMEPAGPGGGSTRAFLRVGGATLARHQLALVLALGCEKVICLARTLESDVLALQHEVEAAGCRFHAVTGPRGLMGLVSTADEVFVLAEGLLPPPDSVSAWLEAGAGVAVQPVEPGLAAGFERIDAELAFGGAMRLPGRLVERLSDLPPDCDAISALMRIALQAGVARRPCGDSATSAPWRLVRDEAEAQAGEQAWIRHLTHRAEDDAAPSSWAARLAVRAVGPSILHAGSGGQAVTIAAGATGLLALGAGWFGLGALGLGTCALTWVLRRTGALLSRVEQRAMRRAPSSFPREALFGWLIDALIVTIVAWNVPPPALGEGWRVFFAPLMLVALVQVLARKVPPRWGGWLDDRAIVALALSAAALLGKLDLAVHGLAAVLAIAAMVWPASGRITRA